MQQHNPTQVTNTATCLLQRKPAIPWHGWRPCIVTLCLMGALLVALLQLVAGWEWPTGSSQGTQLQGPVTHATRPVRRFKIGTFNIHGGYGSDGRLDLPRIANVMQGMDFVGLNEVRGGGWNEPRSQVEQLATHLDCSWLFAPTESIWSGPHFGQGVLSRLPVTDWKRVPFSRVDGNGYRNYVECQIPLAADHAGPRLTILITHLDRKADRQDQLRLIINRFLQIAPPVILMGDLNSKRTEPQLIRLADTPEVIDCFGRFASGEIVRKRIDWMFARGLNCIQASLEPTSASDHPWGWAEFEFDSTKPVP